MTAPDFKVTRTPIVTHPGWLHVLVTDQNTGIWRDDNVINEGAADYAEASFKEQIRRELARSEKSAAKSAAKKASRCE